MDAQKILTADFDDLVFEGRNKSYGAYYLRKKYSHFMLVALLIASALYIVGFASPYILSLLEPPPKPIEKKAIKYTELSEPPPIDKNEPPPPPPNVPPPPKTVKFTPPVIKPDEEVKPEDVPPPVEELQKQEVSTVTEVDPNATVTFDVPDQVVEEAKPQIFTFVEQMPEFPGGNTELMKFLNKNLRYPPAARENGIEGRVVLQFVVDESGRISDIQPLREIGGGTTEEAIRVVKAMPPWKAGKQNGNPVKVYFKLPITFKMTSSE